MLLPWIRTIASKSAEWQILHKVTPQCCGQTFLRYSKTQYTENNENNEDKPVPYLSSQAANWKAEHARIPPSKDVSWITPYSVTISTAAFLIYFLILREENDIDDIIYRPLPETVKGIEKFSPKVDFYTPPDHVVYFEARKKEKLEQNREKTK